MSYTNTIRDAMRQRRYTQRDLAARLGASAAYISDLLHGARRLSPGMAVRLETVLGLDAKELLTMQLEADLRHVRGQEPTP